MVTPKEVQNILGGEIIDEESINDGVSGGRQPTIRLDYTDTKEQQTKYTKTKIIKSGGLIEIYDYGRAIRYGFKNNSLSKKIKQKRNRSEEYRNKTIYRAINNIRRLIHLNFTENDKFITLTFSKKHTFNINNLKECLPYYKKFMRQLRVNYPTLKYITVPEFQTRGAVHYHILCDIPFIVKSELQKLWPYGFSKPKAVKSSTYLAFYLCKYLGKKFDDPRKQGHRLFYSSRGLKRPTTAYGKNAEGLSKYFKRDQKGAIQYESEYDTEQNGKVQYKQYLLTYK